ncbi:MAG: phosphodiesterase, partial [Lachnospiraceae bacterium]|nr:phosphodiesterase [Lachnospiraceae bacterium]
THLLKAEKVQAEGVGQITILNPGSTSIPKGGNPATYGMLEDGIFSILTFQGEVVKQLAL